MAGSAGGAVCAGEAGVDGVTAGGADVSNGVEEVVIVNAAEAVVFGLAGEAALAERGASWAHPSVKIVLVISAGQAVGGICAGLAVGNGTIAGLALACNEEVLI